MSRDPEQQPRRSSDLAPSALAVAAFASVVATGVIGRFGLTGTVLGAALLPVLITIVRELGKAPAERMTRIRVPRPDGRHLRLRRPRWGVVATTSAAAFAIAVAVFTIPDMITGRSVVSDRPSTFFSRGAGTTAGDEPGAERPAPATTTEEEAPEAPATTAPATVTEPETETAPPATTAPAPPEAAPPATTAPAPEPQPAPPPPG